jgi:hypothetical protein
MTATDRVLLRGGVSVLAAAYVLLIDFEARGVAVTRDGADLLVGPSDLLTPEDGAAIRALKPELLRLLDFMARPDLDAHLFSDQPREAAHA